MWPSHVLLEGHLWPGVQYGLCSYICRWGIAAGAVKLDCDRRAASHETSDSCTVHDSQPKSRAFVCMEGSA
jgi:hypothetical protein